MYLVGESSLDRNVSLVQLEPDGSVDGPLRRRNGGGDKLPLGREEVTVVEDVGEGGGDELVSERSDVPVEGETLEVHVRDSEDGRSGGLVASSRLDSDEPVLDNVDSSDPVLSGERVEGEEDLDRVGDGLLGGENVNLGGDTLGELNQDVLGRGGGVLGVGGELPHVSGRGRVGVLKDTGLVRDVEQVLVYG